MNIGLFDSGLGGLTILKAVAKALSQYDYSYYGDTAHLPYGDKSEAEIYEYTKVGMRYLFERSSALIIVACNTASAETLRRLQTDFLPTEYPDRKILGVIIPTIETLLTGTTGKALLLATKRTIDSSKYEKELANRTKMFALTSLATPELVPLIEAGDTEGAVAHTIVIIDEVRKTQPEITTVILGCTHYTVLTSDLRAHYGSTVTFISQDEIVPTSLEAYLTNHPEVAERIMGTGKRTIHLTEHRPDYDQIIGQLLGGTMIEEN